MKGYGKKAAVVCILSLVLAGFYVEYGRNMRAAQKGKENHTEQIVKREEREPVKKASDRAKKAETSVPGNGAEAESGS